MQELEGPVFPKQNKISCIWNINKFRRGRRCRHHHWLIVKQKKNISVIDLDLKDVQH